MPVKSSRRTFSSRRLTASGLGVVLALLASKPSLADEGGSGVWLLGSYGSMAAVPYEPGVSVAALFYSSTASLKDAPASAQSTAVYSALTYAFETPVLGGQLALTAIGAFGGFQVLVDNRIVDSRTGFDDVAPVAALRWNAGVNNFLTYALANVPIGDYDSSRLVNPGLGHWAIDSGAGYTYFEPKTGYEFSTVAGLTYNFQNPSTSYQNGLDFHIEAGASKFIGEHLQVGAVGYFYQQLTPDQGQDPSLGDFKARVAAVGPQHWPCCFRLPARARLRQPEGLPRVRCREPTRGLECMADAFVPRLKRQKQSVAVLQVAIPLPLLGHSRRFEGAPTTSGHPR